MGTKTGIEWTEATWNPLRGCSRVSEGCRNCYAERMAARFAKPGEPYGGLIENGHWSGQVKLVEDHLDNPLRWRKPRRIFVNSMSDLFHESLHDDVVDQVFAVMALAHRHTFQVLTKRPDRMLDYLSRDRRLLWATAALLTLCDEITSDHIQHGPTILPNVWLGVSVEDQAAADKRIPLFLQTPAALRFVSCEPLLASVDLTRWLPHRHSCRCAECYARALKKPDRYAIDWVIAGGESGPGARPMHPDWARSLRDQCQDAGVPFFFKQWGEFEPLRKGDWAGRYEKGCSTDYGEFLRVGKQATGCLLDGEEWKQFPNARRSE